MAVGSHSWAGAMGSTVAPHGGHRGHGRGALIVCLLTWHHPREEGGQGGLSKIKGNRAMGGRGRWALGPPCLGVQVPVALGVGWEHWGRPKGVP